MSHSSLQSRRAEVKEFGPFHNRSDAFGGYFMVCGFSFHWFEDSTLIEAARAPYRKTREQALRAAEVIRDAALAGVM
ncbi:hypothetical protein [Caballeronia sp. LZ032]|uniref:hypothetical protein n=1 Tax=Caballeronia sp. LZ032 TaxID=3038565 RepID=UPI00285F95D1|nr:hypothetical protein [Caballeronia sp. LZ032]MDR5883580.1 hypothetical protein [Caballeronia sp. LZ032]